MSNKLNIKEERIDIVKKTSAVISCPDESHSKWNHHPKVFLNLSFDCEVKCPYCGTSFIRVTNGHSS